MFVKVTDIHRLGTVQYGEFYIILNIIDTFMDVHVVHY